MQGVDEREIHGQVLLDQIKLTSFEGVTGAVSYDANSDRNGNFDLMNHRPQGDELLLVVSATWEASSDTF
eukprot:1304917-Amphidinium_carterae.1